MLRSTAPGQVPPPHVEPNLALNVGPVLTLDGDRYRFEP